MTKIGRVLSVIAFVTVASSSLFGAQISFSHTTVPAAPAFTDSFTLQDFDPTLGFTLTNITITLAYSSTGEVDIFNFTGAPKAFTNATSSVPLTVSAPAGLSLTATAVGGPISGTALAGFNTFPGLTANGSSSISVAPANFGAYEGPGASSAAFTLSAGNGSFGGSAAPGVFFGGSAVAGGTTTITYTYTVPTVGTPEPATMALFGSALIGLGFLRKKITSTK